MQKGTLTILCRPVCQRNYPMKMGFLQIQVRSLRMIIYLALWCTGYIKAHKAMFSLRCSRKHNRCAYKLFLQLCRIISVVHLQLWQGDHDTPETECAAAARDRLIHVHHQLCFLVVDLSNPLCWIITRYQSYASNALLCFLWVGAETSPRGHVVPPPDPSPPPGAPSETMEETVQDRQWYPQRGAVRSYTIPPRLARTPPAVDGVGGGPTIPPRPAHASIGVLFWTLAPRSSGSDSYLLL